MLFYLKLSQEDEDESESFDFDFPVELDESESELEEAEHRELELDDELELDFAPFILACTGSEELTTAGSAACDDAALGFAFGFDFDACLADGFGVETFEEANARGAGAEEDVAFASFCCSFIISVSVFTFEDGFSEAGIQAASIKAGTGYESGDTDRAMCSACVWHLRASLHHAFKQFMTFVKFSGVNGLTLQDLRHPLLLFLAWKGQLACQT